MAGFSVNELDQLLGETRSALPVTRPEDERGTRAGDKPVGSGGNAAAGVGESANGHVRATVSAERLEGLEFGPRAMRLASQELGEHIVTAVNAAFADLRTHGAADAGEAGAVADTERLTQQVKQVQELSLRQMQVMSQSIADLMARMHGGRR